MTEEEREEIKDVILPARYHGCTWETFDLDYDGSDEMDSFLLLREWTGDDGEMAFIFGGPGTGKTHMAVATALRWINARGWGCKFVVVSDWLQDIKTGFNDQTAANALHRAREAKLLIFDDLGAEMATDWVRDTVYSVINHRYNEMKPTLVTSNLTPDEISSKYHDRLASRLASGLVIDTDLLPDRRVGE